MVWLQGAGQDRWQTLNAAMLAFISSLVAFNIAKYNANKRRERQFVAARAFLPEALSELTQYCRVSASNLWLAWESIHKDVYIPKPAAFDCPALPARYREIFSSCIEHAESEVAEYLAEVLRDLQVHYARMGELVESLAGKNGLLVLPANIVSYTYSLGKIQTMINRLFPFARGVEPFSGQALEWDDFRNAYANLNLHYDDMDDLVGFTNRAIEQSRRS